MTPHTLMKIETACERASVAVEYLGYCILFAAGGILWLAYWVVTP